MSARRGAIPFVPLLIGAGMLATAAALAATSIGTESRALNRWLFQS